MTTKTDTKLKWIPVNEASLSEKRRKELAKVREMTAAADKARSEWNAALIADARKSGKLPEGQTFRIGHRTPWGQFSLSVAMIPEKDATASKTRNTTNGLDLS